MTAATIDPSPLRLDDWVRRLSEVCPAATELTPEVVRAAMEERHFHMEDWEQPKRAAPFKYVLFALASRQSHWLYASDWKGSRNEAARAFETLLALPPNHLSPRATDPLEDVAESANRAARELATVQARLHHIAPYDDDVVFALVTSDVLDAMVAARLIAAENSPRVDVAPTPPTLKMSDELMGIEAFSNEAQNLFENMALRTVGDLMGSSQQRLAQACRNGDLVRHVQGVLKRAGLRLPRTR
jgi:hypothetical protein